MNDKITMQDQILKELFLRNKEMGVKEISEKVRLKDSQIWRAVYRLTQRDLVSKRKETNQAKQNIPPFKSIFIKIRNKEYVGDYLNAKGLL